MYAYHVVASHWPTEEKTAHAGLGGHPPRGQAENFNKELTHGLGLEQLPCGESGANAVFSRIVVLAYNLFVGFKRLACPAAWASQTIATVRWKLGQVAGRILRHAGQVVLRLVLEAEALACGRRHPPAVLGTGHGALTQGGRRDTGNRWRRGSGVPPLAILQRAWPS